MAFGKIWVTNGIKKLTPPGIDGSHRSGASATKSAKWRGLVKNNGVWSLTFSVLWPSVPDLCCVTAAEGEKID